MCVIAKGGEGMLKRFGLIKRLPGLSRAQMSAYWRNTHGPLVANVETYWDFTEKYIQNHPLDIATERVPRPEFDGVLESWQRAGGGQGGLFAETDGYRKIMRPDEENFVDRPASLSMLASANAIVKGPRVGVKLLSFNLRNPAITHAEFVRYWRDVHAPLICAPGGVSQFFDRYVQHYVQPGSERYLDGRPSPYGFDGVLELWFPDVDHLNACFESRNYLENIVPDEARFVTKGSVRFLLQEVEFNAGKRTP